MASKKIRVAFTENSVSLYRGKKRVYHEPFVPVEFFAGRITGTDKRTTHYQIVACGAIARTLRQRQLWALHQWWKNAYRTARPACLDWTPRVHFNLMPVMAKIEIKNLNELLTVRP
ncbi:hypothetical protein ASESINO_148 [Erwinia phage vB_EamM_Asesino]|uniref:Uncharacterized protein n=1 Tax=Erwinia phage vB_EamM_Asesino TaxID=1883370 RepID=A0A1B2IA91_9CAUD|nr:hypothetical protein ASESINO_148 [Erwinia phage vB_EamM_Asesino]ANZ48161.1 hypothetical protein ASESINO_148 [Erwinia phage vB_EamM_Asesino]